MHACARGENITVIFVNNAIYGMTGGQMAPTTLVGMNSTSTPGGRKSSQAGFPFVYVRCWQLLTGQPILHEVHYTIQPQFEKLNNRFKLAFRTQMAGLGLSLVEVLSPCPVNWRLEPEAALEWLSKQMIPQYPLGEFKVIEGVAN